MPAAIYILVCGWSHDQCWSHDFLVTACRHVSSTDRVGKRYRNMESVFTIGDDDGDDGMASFTCQFTIIFTMYMLEYCV